MHQRLQRKLFLIEARKCAYCGLIFRYPTDTRNEAAHFYENAYDGQQATTLPSKEELERMLETQFENSPFDKSHRVSFIQSISPNGLLLDFGCSWGYALQQFKAAGYKPIGFELAHNRADFGRRALGIDIRTEWETLRADLFGQVDIIYADHTLEHTSDLRQPLEGFSQLLKVTGLLIIFVPNGGSLIGRSQGVRWKPYIGETHTIAFTDQWWVNNLPRHGFSIERIFSSANVSESLYDGEELVCVARRH